MIFTQEQIDEIKQRLSLSGIKDSELDKLDLLEHPLTGEEVITIVKDGENLRISVEDLYEEFAKYINKEGFFNVSVYLGRLDPEFENAAKPCTLEEAINACPPFVKNAGQIITFIDNNKEWQRYQYQGSSVENWNKLTLWKDLNNVSEDIPISEDVMTFNITEYMPGGIKYKQPIWAGIYTIDGITPVSQYRVIFGCDENLGDVEGVDMEASDTLAILDINTNDATIFSYILFVGNSIDGYIYQTTIPSDGNVPDWISKAFGNNSSYVAANIASLERKINVKLGDKSSIVRVDDYLTSSKEMPNGYFMFEQQPVSQTRVLYDNDAYLLFIQAAVDGTGTMYFVFENFDEYYESWRYLNQYTEENCPSNVLEAFGLNVATSNNKGMMSATDKSNLDGSFKNVSYNSTTKKLIFTKNNNTTISLDATPFIKDGMVNNVSIDNGYLVITFNTDSGKESIRIPLTDVFNPADYYTKQQADSLLGNKVDKEQGKGLSTNDYTNVDKNKLSALPTNAALTETLSGLDEGLKNTEEALTDNLPLESFVMDDYSIGSETITGTNISSNGTVPIKNCSLPYISGNTITIDGVTYSKAIRKDSVPYTDGILAQFDFEEKGIATVYYGFGGGGSRNDYYLQFIFSSDDSTILNKNLATRSVYDTAYDIGKITLDIEKKGILTIKAIDKDWYGGYSDNGLRTNIVRIDFKAMPLINVGDLKDSLATVATTGSYNDLSDKPSIPTNIVDGITINSNTITPTDGKINLGTVIKGVKKGTTTLTPSSGVVTIPQDTTPTNNSTNFITSGGVYTALQNYEIKLSFTTSSTTSYTATRNKYCRFTTTLSSLGISLPTSSLAAGDTCAFNFTTSSSFSSFIITGGTVKKMKDFAIEANKTYEVVALYDGAKWLVTATEFE